MDRVILSQKKAPGIGVGFDVDCAGDVARHLHLNSASCKNLSCTLSNGNVRAIGLNMKLQECERRHHRSDGLALKVEGGFRQVIGDDG